MDRLNPALHLWVVFNDIESSDWNGVAVFHTLENENGGIV